MEEQMFDTFQTISLEDLNAKASMLERRDNKYVVTRDTLLNFLHVSNTCFDVLDIKGVQQFSYDTTYYDGEDHECYRHHHQGRRRRCKVRIRSYRDAKLTFLEVKLKDKRGQTVKRRMKLANAASTVLSDEQRCFVGFCYRELYDDALNISFNRIMDMTYRRSTLVARIGGERMTIDSQLKFFNGHSEVQLSDDVFIVETKSSNGNGIADKYLRKLHQHPANRCSKYCTGLAMLDNRLPHNKFKSTLVRMGVLQ
jgi:VTC domain